METFFIYFIKVSVLVSLFYLAYWLFLKKETFFSQNRWFLLSGLVTSLVLPLIIITRTIWVDPEPVVFEEPFFIPDFQNEIIAEEQKTTLNWSYIITGLYIAGALFFFIKFILSSLSLYKILRQTPGKKQNGYTYLDNPNIKAPFSFFNTIAYDSTQFSDEELQDIITHEKIHAKQKHSADVIIAELFTAVFWFNPINWLYKKAMLQNLEFIADQNTVKHTESKINYQKTLLKITLKPEILALTNPFYQSLIKKRIVMLNKNQSKKRNVWKYALILPLLVLFVMQFQTKVVAQTKENQTFEPVKEEQILISQDTTVWIKDFAKAYESKADTISWKDVKEYMKKDSIKEKIVLTGSNWNDVKVVLNDKAKIYDRMGENPLIIINGKEFRKDYFSEIKDFKLETKGKVTYYDIESAVKKYGEKGKDGAIVLEGQIGNLKLTGKATKSSEEKELLSSLKTVKDYKQIDIYNRWGNLVYSLKPNEKLDEKKLNTLEDGTYFYTFEKSSGEKISGHLFKGNQSTENVTNTNSLYVVSKNEKERNPLYIVNGKEISREELTQFDHNTFESITVVKDKELLKKYGDKGHSDVFEIKIKNVQDTVRYRQEILEERMKAAEKRNKLLEERKKMIEEQRKNNFEEKREKTRANDYKSLESDNNGFVIPKTSKESLLVFYKSELKKIGIEMKFSNIKRNKNGEIYKIKISLSENSGTKDNKKEVKTESVIERGETEGIPDIFVGKSNGNPIISY